MTESVLRLPNVKARTGLSRSLIYKLIKADQFPKQINLGAQAVGWLSSEVDEWLQERIAESRQDCA